MPKSNKIYLDFASGALPNPSGIHLLGMQAKEKLQNARLKVAQILSAKPEEIIFTSGGTESNNLAIQGIVYSWTGKGLPHLITTNTEHSSILETFRILEKRKMAQITIIPVEENGVVDPRKIKKAIKKNTILISVHYANNEIGTIQPIREIAKAIRHYKKGKVSLKATFPFFHIDAVQGVNYLDINVERLGVDLLTLSGVKIENAGRVGVLYKKKSIPLAPVLGGGDQEFGLRPGTENVAEIVKFSTALQKVQDIKNKEFKRVITLRDYFIDKLFHSNIGADFRMTINGDLENRLPNNINITIPNIPSDLLVVELSARGIMVSAKSACKAGDNKASHVIKAINKSMREEDGSLRFSLGRTTTKKEIDYAVSALSEILNKLKRWYTPTPI